MQNVGQVDRTGLISHRSRTPTAIGSNWCTGRRGTLTGSPRRTSARIGYVSWDADRPRWARVRKACTTPAPV